MMLAYYQDRVQVYTSARTHIDLTHISSAKIVSPSDHHLRRRFFSGEHISYSSRVQTLLQRAGGWESRLDRFGRTTAEQTNKRFG
jgi:hypothetical protein